MQSHPIHFQIGKGIPKIKGRPASFTIGQNFPKADISDPGAS